MHQFNASKIRISGIISDVNIIHLQSSLGRKLNFWGQKHAKTVENGLVVGLKRLGESYFPAKRRWNSNMSPPRKTYTYIFRHHARAPPFCANKVPNPSSTDGGAAFAAAENFQSRNSMQQPRPSSAGDSCGQLHTCLPMSKVALRFLIIFCCPLYPFCPFCNA